MSAAVFAPVARAYPTRTAAAAATAATREVLSACGRAVHATNVALVVVLTWPQLHAALAMALLGLGLVLTNRRSAAMAVALGFVLGCSVLAS